MSDHYCNDCGLRHDPNDKAACIEGHGDDPAPADASAPGEPYLAPFAIGALRAESAITDIQASIRGTVLRAARPTPDASEPE